MVVVPLVAKHLSNPEELADLVKTRQTARSLRHREFVCHLIPGSVASASRPVWLPDEPDGEAAFSVHKANHPAEPDQSFLLIACTHRIVTSAQTSAALVAWDSQGFQHMAGCAPCCCQHGGQRMYLRTVYVVATHSVGGGIGYPLCVSPRRSDCIISEIGVRRTVSEGSRRIAWPSLLIACTCALLPVYHNITTLLVAQDTQGSQHIAGFW